jgi:hypothetical protein
MPSQPPTVLGLDNSSVYFYDLSIVCLSSPHPQAPRADNKKNKYKQNLHIFLPAAVLTICLCFPAFCWHRRQSRVSSTKTGNTVKIEASMTGKYAMNIMPRTYQRLAVPASTEWGMAYNRSEA